MTDETPTETALVSDTQTVAKHIESAYTHLVTYGKTEEAKALKWLAEEYAKLKREL